MSRVPPDPTDIPLADPDTSAPTRIGAAPVGSPAAPTALGGYRVEKLLGQGGMGAVYLARDEKLDRAVALKTMKPDLAADHAHRERFEREARAAAKISHDNVIAILHVGEDAGTPYIVMPLLEGEPLDRMLRGNPLPPLGVVLKVGRETADGLAAAHARGLIHRDIKPANIWLEGDATQSDWAARFRRVKVLDFGLARPQADDTHLTDKGSVMGTPAYMSPEQARAHPLDGRTDVFSLGIVLYQMTTGKMPFDGGTYAAIMTSLAVDTPIPPNERNPNVPAALSDLIMRMLSKQREARPDAAQLVTAIRAAEAGPLPTVVAYLQPVAAPEFNPFTELNTAESGPAPVAEPTPLPVHTQAPQRAPGVVLWVTAALASLLAVALVVIVVLKIARPEKKEPVAGGPTPTPPTKSSPKKDPDTPVPPLPPLLPRDWVGTQQDNAAAEWVMSVGGRVAVLMPDGLVREFKIAKELPTGPLVLTAADLADCSKATDADLKRFAGLAGLERLILNKSGVKGPGLKDLTDLPRLYGLSLGSLPIKGNDWEAVGTLRTLTSLDADACGITDADLKHLAGLKELISLSLNHTEIGGESLKCVKNMPRLRALYMNATNVTGEGVKQLKDATELQRLYLAGKGLKTGELKPIKGLPQLQTLEISDQPLTDADVDDIPVSVSDLILFRTQITEAGRAKLKARNPNMIFLPK